MPALKPPGRGPEIKRLCGLQRGAGHQRDRETPIAVQVPMTDAWPYWPQSLLVKRSLTIGRLVLYSLNS